MGTSVHGLKPKHSVGEQFGRNIWGWKPLMDYIADDHKKFAKLFDKERLTELQANRIADALFDAIASGKAEAYADTFTKKITELPLVACEFCEGTGIRKDAVGMEKGMTDLVLDPRIANEVGRLRGWCNGCFGKGMKQTSDSAYYLELTDIVEFAEFLRNCGGAKIS